MKLICPKCYTKIDQNHLNILEGVASCSVCNEVFRIADHLRSDEELSRIKKPHYSEVQFKNRYGEAKLIIPPEGWNGNALFFLFFALIWNGLTWSFLIEEKHPSFFLIPFCLIGILLIAILIYVINGKTSVTLNREKIEIKRSIFGWAHTSKRQTKNLKKITEDVMYTKNYQPVYGIGLYFSKESKLKFGSSLKEEERKWIIGELYELKQEFQGEN